MKLLLNMIFICQIVLFGFFREVANFSNLSGLTMFIFTSLIFFIDKNQKINRKIIYAFSFVSFIVILTIMYSKYDLNTFNMYFVFIFFIFGNYYYIKYTSLENCVKTYINLAVIIGILGIIQQVGFLFNIEYLYDFSKFGFMTHNYLFNKFRVASIFPEPANYGFFMSFPFIISLQRLEKENKALEKYITIRKSLLIIISFIISFSLSAYTVIIIYMIFRKTNNKLFKFIVAGLLISVIISFNVQMKNKLLRLFFINSEISSGKMGASTFALYSNLYVLIESYKNSWKIFLFGNGWNTHRFLYDQYIEKISYLGMNGLNRVDGSSMYIRLLTELGIIGFIFILFIIFMQRIKIKKDNILYIFNFSAFVSLLTYMIRSGNYSNIFPILMILILFISKSKEKKDERSNELI